MSTYFAANVHSKIQPKEAVRYKSCREGVPLVEWGTISGTLAFSLIINSHKWPGLINFKSIFQNTKTNFEMTFVCFYLHLIMATVLLMVAVLLMVPPLYTC